MPTKYGDAHTRIVLLLLLLLLSSALVLAALLSAPLPPSISIVAVVEAEAELVLPCAMTWMSLASGSR